LGIQSISSICCGSSTNRCRVHPTAIGLHDSRLFFGMASLRSASPCSMTLYYYLLGDLRSIPYYSYIPAISRLCTHHFIPGLPLIFSVQSFVWPACKSFRRSARVCYQTGRLGVERSLKYNPEWEACPAVGQAIRTTLQFRGHRHKGQIPRRRKFCGRYLKQ
jgi:hypothetical protein